MSSMHGQIEHIAKIGHEDTLSELSIRENARWLALLIDTEGAIGWTIQTMRKDKVDAEYKYTYRYALPYISVGMSEKESKRTMEKAGKLVERTPSSAVYDGESYLYVHAETRKALVIIDSVEPFLDKFSRMALLLKTLFKHRNSIDSDRFIKVITNLFGKSLKPKEAQDEIIEMTEREFEVLIQKAKKQTAQYLT